MNRLAALLCLVLCISVHAESADWDDPYYSLRVPISVEAPAAGRYALDLDAHRITQWISEVDRFGYHPNYFGYDHIKVVEVLPDGSTKPVDARFEMHISEELIHNGSFEKHEGGRATDWLYTQPVFDVREHPEGGHYLSTEGADRNACLQNLKTVQRRWYRFSCRMRGRGSCSPQITRLGEGWQPLEASWTDPYFKPDEWRDTTHFVYTGDKDLWQTDTVQVRIERFTADVDDVSFRACDVKLVMHVASPGAKKYYLYYAPQEGIMPSPPSALTDALPAKTLSVVRRGMPELYVEPVMYGVGVGDDNADIWYTTSTSKIGPDDPAPKVTRDKVRLGLARNESEAIQLVFRSKSGGTIEKVDLSLAGPNGGVIDNAHVEVRQAKYVPIRQPSQPDYNRFGRSKFVGRLPDPLPLFKPVSYLPGSENILLWLDVRVPADASAGVYNGKASITTTGGTYAVPIELTVWDFVLPDRPTCRTSLQFSRYANQFLFPFHKVETQEDKYEISRKYIAEMARYRITAKAPAAAAVWNPDGPGHTKGDAESIQRYESELPWAFEKLHVTGFALGHVSGPSMPNQDEAARAKAAAYYEPLAQWLKDHGYLNRSFIQIDEPRPIHFDAMRKWIDAVRSTDVGRDILMFGFVYNADCFWDLRNDIDIMVPINNDAQGIVSPKALAVAPDNQEMWFYYTRTAHMWIDAPGLDQRLWAPQVWAYGGKGFAVWGINQWWVDTGKGVHDQYNPWENPLSTWGNGSLAYFYPPDPLGKEIPRRDMAIVPSMRLLLTRDGIEDFEYGVILQKLIASAKDARVDTLRAEQAVAMLRRPFTTPRSWTIAEAYWHEARQNAAKAIVDLQSRLP